MSELIYIAGPYTKGVWENNVRDVIEAAEIVVENGDTPFIPHTMTTLWALVYPKGHDEWLEIDLAILDRCDGMIRLNGESEGADIEADYAIENDIPIYYNIEEYQSAD